MSDVFEFELPRGYVDGDGVRHRQGLMRLATARDEVEAVNHPQVVANAAYLPIVLLSRVVVALGELGRPSPQAVGDFYAADLVYLQDLYMRLNSAAPIVLNTVCPHCQGTHAVQVAPIG